MRGADEGSGEEVPGAWVEPEVSYVAPERRHCAYCGRPIARRYWAQELEGEAEAYCSPDHAAQHATYPMRLKKMEGS